MKIALFSTPELSLGKHNVKDEYLDQIFKISKSKKETYVQVELVDENGCVDADAIITKTDCAADLILKDLEFIETRLSRTADEEEKILLNKLKDILERENFVFGNSFSEPEKKLLSGYGILTNKPVIVANTQELEDKNTLLQRCLKESGFISFFTTGEKETRAWLIKGGTSAYEAAGVIHSDIQRGFIRAEIIAFKDFIEFKGETPAKQAGKMRLEQKDYVIQDRDLVNFRFNK